MKFSRLALAVLLLSFSACAGTVPGDVVSASRAPLVAKTPRAKPKPTLRVVMLALDGVRWQEIFHGVDPRFVTPSDPPETMRTAEELMPNLHRLIDRGVGLGDQDAHSLMLASGPNFISLPGYSEMLSGKAPLCESNDCMKTPDATLADEFRALPGIWNDEVVVMASWEVIGRVAASDPTKMTISTGRLPTVARSRFCPGADDHAWKQLLDTSSKVGPSPGGGDYRPDAYTAALALARFERAPRPRFAFIGLGDTDEYGHAGAYRSYLGALERADRLLGDLIEVVDGWGPEESSRVIWLVTSDHGRSPDFRSHGKAYPSSSGTWLAAAGAGIPALGRMDATTPHHLSDIAPTVRVLAGLPEVSGERAGSPIDEIVLGTLRTGP